MRNKVVSVQGFSLLELSLALLGIAILSTVLLNRLSFYQEMAEKADMEYTASVLKSALRLKMARLMIDGRAQEIGAIAEDNPMDWLETKPPIYAGTVSGVMQDNLDKRQWYFDTSSRTLVYLVGRSDHFQADSEGKKRVRFKVITVKNSGSENDATAKNPTDTVKLQLVESYKWF